MNQNSPSPDSPNAVAVATRPITRELVRARTCELALLAGRPTPYVNQADYEQAKRELTGETDTDRQLRILDAADAITSRLSTR